MAVYHNIQTGTFRRFGYKPATSEKMLARVLRGQYDDDLDNIREDLDEDVDGGNPFVNVMDPPVSPMRPRSSRQLADAEHSQE